MLGVQAAQAEGMPIVMNLEAGANTPDQPLARVRRNMLVFHDKVSDLKRNLLQPASYDGNEQPLSRIIAIDLATLYDPNPLKQEKNVGDLMERIHRMRINTVYLRAAADLDHDGKADATYFPNHHLPVRADLFNRVTWQLLTRAAVPAETFYVYAWLPINKFELPSGHTASRQAIKDIYEDAAKNAPRIGGLLLGDDKKSVTVAGNDLAAFTHELIATFKVHQPYAFTALFVTAFYNKMGIDAAPAFESFLKQYDFVTVPVSRIIEDPDDTENKLEALTDKVAQIPIALNSTAFLIHTTAGSERIPSEHLATQLRLLQQNGVRNFGYYPKLASSPLVSMRKTMHGK